MRRRRIKKIIHDDIEIDVDHDGEDNAHSDDEQSGTKLFLPTPNYNNALAEDAMLFITYS